jgi:hypothetical protein
VRTTILWKLRQRFGITAPQVAVRPQMPWYMRWLGFALLAGLCAAAALWVFARAPICRVRSARSSRNERN